MINELIFLLSLLVVSISSVVALFLGSSALIGFLVLQVVLANLFVTKEIILFGLTATSSDALAVGATLSLNLLQEYYGRSLARKAIAGSFFCLVLYALFSKLHLSYIPYPHDTTQIHFLAILGSMPRIVAASTVTYLIIDFFDSALFNTLKEKTALPFFLRNTISISITHLLDTIIFSFLALYGIVDNIAQIIFISYIIKLITIFCLIPLVHLLLELIKRQLQSN